MLEVSLACQLCSPAQVCQAFVIMQVKHDQTLQRLFMEARCYDKLNMQE